MSGEALAFLLVPTLACFILVGVHAYLGIHVLARGVIFVDIALAQIAALGSTVGFLLGHSLDGVGGYFYSLAFTFAGAALFAGSRGLAKRVPEEAIIGIVYAVAAATTLVLVDKAPHGAAHIKHLLVGNILWVTPLHVAFIAGLYGAVGLFHFVFRRRFLRVSLAPDEVSGRQAMLWDLLFYLSFGVVITSSVQVAGVLLVFTFLIVPAVFAALFADGIKRRLIFSWTFGFVVSVCGVVASYSLDLPTGAAVVASFALALVASLVLRALVRTRIDRNAQMEIAP